MESANDRRGRLKECAERLRLELGRAPRRTIGSPWWQHKARKLLSCLRRLERLSRPARRKQDLEEARGRPVA